MSFQRIVLAIGLFLTVATATLAQVPIVGMVGDEDCSRVRDPLSEGGELYALKLHEPPTTDFHTDWLFDLRGKGGANTTGTDAGGPSYFVPATWRDVQAPTDDMFVFVTFPGGGLAFGSGPVQDRGPIMGGGVFGTAVTQQVGNSLPVGIDAGIGLVLSGTTAPYMVDMGTGTPAAFPFGSNSGIEVVFAPIAEINSTQYPGGCQVGGTVPDRDTGFGLIVGYNVYRVADIDGTAPTPLDFMGDWQYYIPLSTLDFDVVNPGPGLPNNGAGDPTPDGDLVGFQNFDGLPYTGDEIIIFADQARNPDGSSRISGVGPDLTGNTCYWYAFQPVVHQVAPLVAHDGLSYSSDALFPGDHTMDADSDGFEESLDLDLDFSPDFYSPQAQIGVNGLGLTNGGFPLLSAPVFGCVDLLIAATVHLSGRRVPAGVELTLTAGYEDGNVVGYDIFRRLPSGRNVVVNDGRIVAQGIEGSTYVVHDTRLGAAARLPTRSTAIYGVTVHYSDGSRRDLGAFQVDLGAPVAGLGRHARR